jgi:adenine-specific DNA-methyltransferase
MKKLNEMTQEELIAEVKNLRSRKKYGLVWEDKPEDVVTRCQTELPVLEEDKEKELALDKANPVTNLILEGDNFHSLSVLNYTHGKKIDLIYIDPPYNTGAKDWKYNNDYVDSEDRFRHSKWLSMMNNRLLIARHLLKKDTGCLVVAIDDYEVNTLGLLLKEIFFNYQIDLIVIEHHPQGAGSKTVSRTHEYAYIVTPQSLGIPNRPTREEQQVWSLKRSGQGENNWRKNRPNQFFAILVNEATQTIVGVDGALSRDDKYEKGKTKEGYTRVYPIDKQGKERVWRYNRETMQRLIGIGRIKITERNSLVVIKDVVAATPVFSVWKGSRYNAGTHGSSLLTSMFGESNKFPYPKSLYNTYDLIKLFVGNNKKAIVLDYFAGSGTTGHATLLLNKEDGGQRKFILCTNNENNIARDVTYPRIKKVIEGYGDQEAIPANLRYFKTDFVKKDKVSDDTRRELIQKATEMICVKESTYTKKYDNKKFKIYENEKAVAGILYELDSIDEFKEKLNSLGKQASIYVFSLTNETFGSDFADLSVKHKLIPIPESILEVYRKLFG